MFGNFFSGLDINSALQMLRSTFEKEGIKSIVVFLDNEGNVKTEKLVFNVYKELNELVANVPEALIYLQNKTQK